MANETKLIEASEILYYTGHAQINDAAFSLVSEIDNAFDNTNAYPFCRIVLTINMTVAADAGAVIPIHRRLLDVNVNNDDENAPGVSSSVHRVGQFEGVSVLTVAQTIAAHMVPCGLGVNQFILENLLGQAIPTTNFKMEIIPMTFGT